MVDTNSDINMDNLREYTLKEINECNGLNDKPILISIDNCVFNCENGRNMYGPGKGYNIFAGHDITYALAINSVNKSDVDILNYKLNESQKQQMLKWKSFFIKKYKIVGKLKQIIQSKL